MEKNEESSKIKKTHDEKLNFKSQILSNLQILIALLTIIAIIIGTYIYIDNRYALKNQLKRIEIRLELEITQDDLLYSLERSYELEDRLLKKTNVITEKEELRKLKERIKDFEKKRSNLNNKLIELENE